MANRSVQLRGDGLLLREWVDADLAEMVPLFDDPEVAYRTPVVTPFGRHAAEDYLARARQATADGTRLHLAVTVGGGPIGGEVILNRITAMIAYTVAPAYRRQGLATRAVRLLTRYAYEVAGLPAVFLQIEADNVGSVAVARATGFRLLEESPEMVEDKGRRYALHRWAHVNGVRRQASS
ncbi:GNAT family N-acetyltransferase [Micromonospora sp. NPDC047707]|uniref:GNAT family N-acetyltransferase n=1 Tax=Micromonospora sp. NPDC047707 TaxID=3154498 RepID=UPI003455B69D